MMKQPQINQVERSIADKHKAVCIALLKTGYSVEQGLVAGQWVMRLLRPKEVLHERR